MLWQLPRERQGAHFVLQPWPGMDRSLLLGERRGRESAVPHPPIQCQDKLGEPLCVVLVAITSINQLRQRHLLSVVRVGVHYFFKASQIFV